MIVAGSTNPLLLASAGGYNLTNSLRFRGSANAYLNRTPASAGNRKTFTFSAWMKRGNLANANKFFATIDFDFSTGTNQQFNIATSSSGQLEVNSYANSSFNFRLITTQVFRDPSAWYHFVVAIDTTQATDTNRVKVYVNGTQITAFSTANYPTQNLDTYMNQAKPMGIGAEYGLNSGSPQAFAGGGWYDGYMTEVNFIDGQALTPSSFGSTSATTGVWQPKKYAGTYGTNGFYLPFTDNSGQTTSSNTGIGKDFSGNGNYWISNNIGLDAGEYYDSMTDVPTLTDETTANYCVMNPLAKNSSLTVQDGNLYCTSSSSNVGASGTLGVSTGKWYWEATRVTGTTGQPMVGIVTSGWDLSYVGSFAGGYAYDAGGNKYNNATATAYGATYTAGDVIGIALDLTAGTITFYKNNTSQGVAFSGLSGEFFPAVSVQNNAFALNFGQQGFKYTPPTGFVALNTFNLPTPTIGATASTQANKYMDATTYTGNGATGQTIVNSGGFQPNFVWVKSRSDAYDHGLQDIVRGATKDLNSNNTDAEETRASSITAFASNGFTVGNDVIYNGSGSTYVGWQWAGGGTGVTNTAGSITSTVSANTTSGFSIVVYTGNAATSATIGHGLGVAPKMVIVKNRQAAVTSSNDWNVYHASLGTGYLILNSTNAYNSGTNRWNGTNPTSTVFSVGGDSAHCNNEAINYVAYCFSEIAGYSKFGSYTGNGSTDGTFVYTGFRPRYVMIKRSDVANFDWVLIDSARDPYNVAGLDLYANSSGAETSNQSRLDLLSSGFKFRSTNGNSNTNGGTYIYAAFAETPLKFSNAR